MSESNHSDVVEECDRRHTLEGDAEGTPIATLVVEHDAPAGAVRELLLSLQGEIEVDYDVCRLQDSPFDRSYTVEIPGGNNE